MSEQEVPHSANYLEAPSYADVSSTNTTDSFLGRRQCDRDGPGNDVLQYSRDEGIQRRSAASQGGDRLPETVTDGTRHHNNYTFPSYQPAQFGSGISSSLDHSFMNTANDWDQERGNNITEGLSDFFLDVKPVSGSIEPTRGTLNFMSLNSSQHKKRGLNRTDFMMDSQQSHSGSAQWGSPPLQRHYSSMHPCNNETSVSVLESSPFECASAGRSFLMDNLEQIRLVRQQQQTTRQCNALLTGSRIRPPPQQQQKPADHVNQAPSSAAARHMAPLSPSWPAQECNQKLAPNWPPPPAHDSSSWVSQHSSTSNQLGRSEVVYNIREMLSVAQHITSSALMSPSNPDFSLKLSCSTTQFSDHQKSSSRNHGGGAGIPPGISDQPPQYKTSPSRSYQPIGKGASPANIRWTSYEPYVDLKEALNGISNGIFRQGQLRVSKDCPDDAYITNLSDPDAPDFLVAGRAHRNRSVHGDVVVFQLVDPKGRKVRDPYNPDAVAVADNDNLALFHPTVKVVHLLEFKGKDKSYVAYLRAIRPATGADVIAGVDPDLIITEDHKFVKAVPVDRRIPWILIPRNQVDNHEKIPGLLSEDSLYRVRIMSWSDNSALPWGRLLEYTGSCNDMECSERVAMIDNELEDHMKGFSDEVKESAESIVRESAVNFSAEVECRADMRSKDFRIFTIDPMSAKDLDDAIHIKLNHSVHPPLYEVGVHIADVSHYVKPGSKIDEEAQRRCTTVYLPVETYTMLPPILCEKACSLNQNEPKLTMSVIFNLKADGSLSHKIPPRFCSSVIRCCARFDYEGAQTILDTYQKLEGKSDEEVNHVMDNLDHPEISGGHSWHDVWQDLILLENLTQQIRKKRFETGSLLLHDLKMDFNIEDMEEPIFDELQLDLTHQDDKSLTAHHLIEELMLRANVLVAEALMDSVVGDFSVLRIHQPPKPKKMGVLKTYLEHARLSPDFSSAGAAHQFFTTLWQSHGPLVATAVEQQFLRTLQQAIYSLPKQDLSLSHYALNFPLYTHFTSPIRRYADVMVHRLLKAAIAVKVDALPPRSRNREGVLKEEKQATWEGVPKEEQLAARLLTLQERGFDFDVQLLQDQCDECNVKRANARNASQDAAVAEFSRRLSSRESLMNFLTCCTAFQDAGILLYVPKLCVNRRVYFNNVQANNPILNRIKTVADQEATLLDRIREKDMAQLVLPTSISIVDDTVEICWNKQRQKTNVEQTDSSLQQSLPYKQTSIRQIIRIFSPLPVFVVPLKGLPKDFFTVPIPPWDVRFRQSVLSSQYIREEEKANFEAEFSRSLERGHVDLCAILREKGGGSTHTSPHSKQKRRRDAGTRTAEVAARVIGFYVGRGAGRGGGRKHQQQQQPQQEKLQSVQSTQQ